MSVVHPDLRTADQRVAKYCPRCGSVDTAPFHDVQLAGGQVVGNHKTCCADAGCRFCQEVLAAAGTRESAALIAYITGPGAQRVAELARQSMGS